MTKNRKSREEIEAMAQRAFAGLGLAAGDEAIVELKQGWFNAAYLVRLADGREGVLKIAPPAGGEIMQYERNIMATEVAAMQLVRQIGAIVREVNTLRTTYLIFPGNTLPPRWPGCRKTVPAAMRPDRRRYQH